MELTEERVREIAREEIEKEKATEKTATLTFKTDFVIGKNFDPNQLAQEISQALGLNKCTRIQI
ncbi:hypothetical protein HMSSN139_26710 [Paenibacillus sp. HMSSN-139]|nr:hypothetical protein HMSSN139_26710 [Paenibacillus sp. HMSSN-139]